MTKHEVLQLLFLSSSPDYTGGLTAREIADEFSYDVNSVYGKLTRWRNQRLVWRDVGDDGRKIYGITNKGTKRYDLN